MLNPEFKKYLWLELSTARLAILALVLGILFYLSHGTIINWPTGPSTCFVVLVIIWGTRQVSQAMSEELAQHTWNRQRMSVLNAWSMVWPKVIGSAIYTWLGGLLCMVAYLYFHLDNPIAAIRDVLLWLCAGLFAQHLSLLLSLQSMQLSRSVNRTQNFAYFALSALMAWWLIFSGDGNSSKTIFWYQHPFSKESIELTTAILCVVWSIIGSIRLMRLELQQRNLPWVWVLFVISTIIYADGFANPLFNKLTTNVYISMDHWQAMMPTATDIQLSLAFGLSIVWMYISLFLETKTKTRWRQLKNNWQQRHYILLVSTMPCYLISFLLSCCIAILLMISMNNTQIILATVIILGFNLRDILIFTSLNINSHHPHRTDMAAAFYLLFTYFVLGGLLPQLGLNMPAMLFVPLIEPHHLLMQLLIIVGEILMVSLYFWRKMQHDSGSISTEET